MKIHKISTFYWLIALILTMAGCRNQPAVLDPPSSSLPGESSFSLSQEGPAVVLDEATITPRAVKTAYSKGSTSLPAVVAEVSSAQQYAALPGDLSPSSAILYLDDTLRVIVDGQPTVTITQALNKLEWQVIPIFYVRTDKQADLLMLYLQVNGLKDCFVASDNPSLIKRVRNICTEIQGIVEFSEESLGTDEGRQAMRDAANASMAKVVLLPSSATADDVVYLQKRLMTVWIRNEIGKTAVYGAVAAGANGIVTAEPAEALSCLNIFDRSAVLQEIVLVAHRGQPVTAQENILQSARDAFENGADVIECDVWMTTDNHIVLSHDGTLDRETNGSGSVEAMTLEQLKQYQVDGNTSLKPEPICTLEELFSEFQGKDILFFIEIKSAQAGIVEVLREKIEQYGMASQVNFISFNYQQLLRCREVMPTISSGYLVSRDTLPSDETAIEAIKDYVQKDSLTFHPSYSTLPVQSGELAAALHSRGMSVWPWTYYRIPLFDRAYTSGWQGLTMEAPNIVKNYVVRLTAPSALTVSLTQPAVFKAQATTKCETQEVSCEPVVIDGDLSFTLADNGWIASATGEVSVLLKYSFKLDTGNTGSVYSAPILVTVTE